VASDLTRYRQEFPHTRDGILYLDHAAVSPMSHRVRGKIDSYLNQVQREKINNYFDTLSLARDVRTAFARLVHASPERIAIVKNTTDGMLLLARGYPWQPSDRVLLHRLEFPSNVYPWYDLKPFGVAIDFLDTPLGRVTPAVIEPAIQDRTRLVAVSWVQYLSGYRNDLRSLARWCHERGILLAVDAMQGVGALKLDVQATGVDFLAAGSAKWLMGPQGIGFVYLTEDLQSRLHPPHLGWHSRIDFLDFHAYDQPLKPDANRFEFATPFSLGVWGVAGALELLLEAGPEPIERRILALTDTLATGLTELGLELVTDRSTPAVKSGIVTVRHPRPERNREIFQELTAANIFISLRSDCLRFSPHFYNTEEEIATLLARLERLL
jgi:selenocysteine lyase/cysteine desulfurase